VKARVLEEIASPDGGNFQFVKGVRFQLPGGMKYHVWFFIPPKGVYTQWELETVADKAFERAAKSRGLEAPDFVWSVGVEDEAMLVVESVGKRSTEG
jgi:hypothetical protein